MVRYSEVVIDDKSQKSKLLALDLFWLGFIIYAVSYSISTSNQVNYAICNLFQVLGLLLFIPASVFLMRLKIENVYLRIIFIIYGIWLFGIMIRGVELDYLTIKQLLFDPSFGMFLYLVPLVILIPVTPEFMGRLYKVIVILAVFYLIFDAIFIRQLLIPYQNVQSQAMIEYFTQQLSLPSGLILLTFIYHKRKINLFALFIMGLTFIFSVLRARRGLMFMSFNILAFSYLFYQLANKTKVVTTVVSFFFLIIVAYSAFAIYENNRKDTFGLITERMGQKTRSLVEEYFYRDLKTKDWIVGKGLNGMYFCPGVEEGTNNISIYRRVIETGYLQVILNGGLISLALLLLIAVPAMIKGLFYSKNMLSKASGLWIFLFLLFMYPGTLTVFSLFYIIVWISIGICFSSRVRNMSDEELKAILIKKVPA